MRSRTAAATASGPRKAAPATYSRVDHIAMVALATVGCLLLLAPQRDPVFTHAVPRPPGRSQTTLNCRILNSTLKLSSCDDNYDDNYVYPLLITGVGRFQCINQIVAARLTSTPSTRRQLDGVALRSITAASSQHCTRLID